MHFFIKDLITKGSSDHAHHYFTRFGKGNYPRRFLCKVMNGKKVKVRASFELANEFTHFVKEVAPSATFSGKVLTKHEVGGFEGKKKAGSFVYEVSDSDLKAFDAVYFYLVDTKNDAVTLKIKKAIPKPGKAADKIDDTFCALDVEGEHGNTLLEGLFWDVPSDAKKAVVEHEIVIDEIVLPEGVDDPVLMRQQAKRKGKIIRTVTVDGNATKSEHAFVA